MVSLTIGLILMGGMVQIFVTFGLAIFIRGACQFFWGGDFKSITGHWLAGRTIELGGVFLPLPLFWALFDQQSSTCAALR
jgi:branched-chain amino acid transport system permease protein